MILARQQKALKGWHVLIYMLGFFALVFVVNGIFLYQAIVSFPGEDTRNSYLQGLDYNATLATRAEQAALGWTAAMGTEGGVLMLELRDADAAPLSNFEATALLRRPSTTADDTLIELVPAGAGQYAGDISGLEAGEWRIVATVTDPQTGVTVFSANKSLLLP